MIKAKVSTDYKDIEHIFAGGAIQKEIIKVWSTEANDYVFEAWKVLEMEGPLPLTFNANGEPLIDYRIYGNTEQTGTPTPENPIMPIGCGERTENLFDKNNTEGIENNYYINGTTGNKVSDSQYYISAPIAVISEETYYWVFRISSGGTLHTAPTVGFFDANDNQIGVASHASSIKSFPFITPANCAYVRASVFKNTPDIGEAMLTTGSTAPTSYIPYGYKLPILSNSTVTNIYLGEVQTTRRIKKLVLTGKESWNTFVKTYYITVTNYYRGYDVGHHLSVCSHYPIAQLATVPEMHYGLGGLIDGSSYTRWNGNIVFNPSPMISSKIDWLSYLATQYANGTPVTVWYVLDEPETAVVNEPLMKIGEYVDTVDSAQTNVQIPTYKGANVIDYDRGEKHFITSDGYELVDKNQNDFLLSGSTDSALYPEKMYIKYKGR